MDFVTLAATAVGVAIPYLVGAAKEAAKGAAGAAGKSVWEWMKGRLGSDAGAEAARDLEADPADATNRQAVEAALAKLLRNDAGAAGELRSLLIEVGAMSVAGDVTVTATNGGVAAGGNMIGNTITTGAKPQK